MEIRNFSKNEIVSLVRRLVKEAKVAGDIPKAWRITVSSRWAGTTPAITVSVRNAGIDGDERALYHNKLVDIVNRFNYNESMPQFDHFDVGYYTYIAWLS